MANNLLNAWLVSERRFDAPLSPLCNNRGNIAPSTQPLEILKGHKTWVRKYRALIIVIEKREISSFSGNMTEFHIDKYSDIWGIHEDLRKNLAENGISEFFPVQSEIIPILLRFSEFNCVTPRDLCVSAPTGSGKTLAYAIPIVQSLLRIRQRHERRLRALIILPGRELAKQVYGVICKLTNRMDIVVYNCIGQTDIQDEADVLSPICKQASESRFSNDWMLDSRTDMQESNIDVLVATPGRLLDHLHRTEGFNLSDLRFLILDEADRLLGNAHQYWIKSLILSTQAQSNHSSDSASRRYPLQRLLFSATLTDNPSKLAMLGVRNPIFIKVSSNPKKVSGEETESRENLSANMGQYVLPSTLSESTLVCTTDDRPKLLVSILVEATGSKLPDHDERITSSASHALCQHDNEMCLVFTSSVDGAHRLCRFLQCINIDNLFGGRVEEMSRLLKSHDRDQIMADATNGLIKVLISTDSMARGIDLQNIRLVVNYDPPKFPRTYVHRAGRTARANRLGHCLTMLKKGQLGAFMKVREAIDFESEVERNIEKCKIMKESIVGICPIYEAALKLMHQESEN